MTREEKLNWLENAENEELLNQFYSLQSGNHFGVNNEDIAMTKAEILKRMEK